MNGQVRQNLIALEAPFSNGHPFLPIDFIIFAIKKNISRLNAPNGLFQGIKCWLYLPTGEARNRPFFVSQLYERCKYL